MKADPAWEATLDILAKKKVATLPFRAKHAMFFALVFFFYHSLTIQGFYWVEYFLSTKLQKPTSYIRVSRTVKLSFGWTLPLKVRVKIIWEHIVNRSPPAPQIAPVADFMKWKCVLGTNAQRSEVAEGQISGSAVMKCIMLPSPHHSSVPSRSCVQLWSRIALQRTHQRVRLIWAVLPQRMGLLSKNTSSQFGTTLISHINIHLRAPKLRAHTGGGGSVSWTIWRGVLCSLFTRLLKCTRLWFGAVFLGRLMTT